MKAGEFLGISSKAGIGVVYTVPNESELQVGLMTMEGKVSCGYTYSSLPCFSAFPFQGFQILCCKNLSDQRQKCWGRFGTQREAA